MEPYDSYTIYSALKLHFESKSYDAIKYNFKTRVTQKSFWKRKDKYFFAKAGKKFNERKGMINFYVSHFVNGKSWIGDMLKDEHIYDDWVKRYESLGYLVEEDLYKLEEEFGEFDVLFKSQNGQLPPIVKSYLAEEVSIETVVIMDKLLGFVNRVDKNINDTILWPDIKSRLIKYGPFVEFDPARSKKIILKVFSS
tara:strand:+ start:1614 stop:2201 length:588 start_codon:yes stop_codon:yes gene_type:complete